MLIFACFHTVHCIIAGAKTMGHSILLRPWATSQVSKIYLASKYCKHITFGCMSIWLAFIFGGKIASPKIHAIMLLGSLKNKPI